MKTTCILTFLGGIILGGGGVFFGLRATSWNSSEVYTDPGRESLVHGNMNTSGTDPFVSGEDGSSGYGLILTDPDSVQQRHMCIALWYADFAGKSFGRHVGHEFGPVWNQRSPVEILEEHLEFMKKFMADTERLEKQTGVDSEEDN
jgi:hypothetical protein